MWAQSAAEIGKVIAAARRHRKLTQTELAGAIGASQKWISEVEKGKDTAHIGKVLRALAYLGVRLKIGEAPWLRKKPDTLRRQRVDLGEIITSHLDLPRNSRRS